jgi:hypothetical protein
MSDLHIGAINVDYDLIDKELREARDNGDRININGDLFDMILPKDHKRYRPDVLHPDLQGRANVRDATIKMGYEILKSSAPYIDMIGMGNHERSMEMYHATDVTASIINKLNKLKNTNVRYGGYTGFIDYRYSNGRTGSNRRVVVAYHHGSGGNAPVTKGMIGFHRKATYVDSDIVWEGHKHNRLVDATPLRMRCPLRGDEITFDQQVFIMTGGYMDYDMAQSHEDVMRDGRKSNYAQDWGLPPQQKGGVRVLVKFHRKTGIEKIMTVV